MVRKIARPDLRRQRVRELLCHLVARRRVRREEIADALWPELDHPARNLRVTLSYLQRLLQPDRIDGEPPYFLRAEGTWLVLAGDDRLDVDAWELDARLDDAESAEAANTPATTLAAYRAALPLWRGEPFADVSDSSWLHPERTRLQDSIHRSGVPRRRTAARRRRGLRSPRRRALRHCCGIGCRACVPTAPRTHLAEGDLVGARRVLDDCRAALADLGFEPNSTTASLLTPGEGAEL